MDRPTKRCDLVTPQEWESTRRYVQRVADKEIEIPKRAMAASGKLNMPSRITTFALGLTALGAGSVAVFTTHLEAGPVAMLAVGLIFMIVGLAGTLPIRLKVGDNEATWEIERQAAERFVERVADTPVANQREFLGALSFSFNL
jgi:hypothetical protein